MTDYLDWFVGSIPVTPILNQGDEFAPPGVKWAGLIQSNPLLGNASSYLFGFVYVGCFLEGSSYHLCGWTYSYPSSNPYGAPTLRLLSTSIAAGETIVELSVSSGLPYDLPAGTPFVLFPPSGTTYPLVSLLTSAVTPAGSTTFYVEPQVAPIAYTAENAAMQTIESLGYVDLGAISLTDATTGAPLSGEIVGIAIVPTEAMGSYSMLTGNAGPGHEVVVFVWEQGAAPADLPVYTLDPANPGNGLTQWYNPGWQFNFGPYNTTYNDAFWPGSLFPPTQTTTMIPVVSAIGPSGPGPNLLAGASKMYLYGPTTNGTEWWTIGVQGCAADGSNPTPIYFYSYYTQNARDRQCLIFGQYPFTPVYDNGKLPADAAGHNVMYGSLNTTEAGGSFYIYAPTAEGEYGFFEALAGGWGLVPNFVSDVQVGYMAAIGTGGDPLYSVAFVVGYSPSQGRVVAAYSPGTGVGFDQAWSWLFNQANPTGNVTDGNNAAGLIVNPVCMVDRNLSSDVHPIFLDDGPYNGQTIPLIPLNEYSSLTADFVFISPPNPAGTRTPWFRQISNFFYTKAASRQLAPLRMFQRSDGFGVRMVQTQGSANSPMSVRNYPHGCSI